MATSTANNDHDSQKTADYELVRTFKAGLNRQTELCKKLEDFADRLPATVDATECLPLAKEVLDSLEQAHRFEDLILFPILQERFHGDIKLDETLDRLRCEHLEDDSFARELEVCLIDFGKTSETDNVNLLGYMLRGFFEGLRRHIAFEQDHILPMLEQPNL